MVLARNIVLCSWARHFTLTVPLYTQVYKWVPANLMLGLTLRWTSIPIQGGVEILLVASCCRNRDKLRPGGSQLARRQTLPLSVHYDVTGEGHSLVDEALVYHHSNGSY